MLSSFAYRTFPSGRKRRGVAPKLVRCWRPLRWSVTKVFVCYGPDSGRGSAQKNATALVFCFVLESASRAAETSGDHSATPSAIARWGPIASGKVALTRANVNGNCCQISQTQQVELRRPLARLCAQLQLELWTNNLHFALAAGRECEIYLFMQNDRPQQKWPARPNVITPQQTDHTHSHFRIVNWRLDRRGRGGIGVKIMCQHNCVRPLGGLLSSACAFSRPFRRMIIIMEREREPIERARGRAASVVRAPEENIINLSRATSPPPSRRPHSA